MCLVTRDRDLTRERDGKHGNKEGEMGRGGKLVGEIKVVVKRNGRKTVGAEVEQNICTLVAVACLKAFMVDYLELKKTSLCCFGNMIFSNFTSITLNKIPLPYLTLTVHFRHGLPCDHQHPACSLPACHRAWSSAGGPLPDRYRTGLLHRPAVDQEPGNQADDLHLPWQWSQLWSVG